MGKNMLYLFAGPCVIENEEQCMDIAEKLKNISEKLNVDLYFKASFDKANRTSIDSYRGPGLDKGLKILNNIKSTHDIKILTDIHEPYQADIVADVVDIIQIPAFLCRQTDLLIAAAQTGKILNVKKGQFLAPWDMVHVINKIESTGNKNIILCERGSSFGYNNLVVDMTSIIEMKKYGYPVVFDATHSVQKPGGKGKVSGGNRGFVEYLAKASVTLGVDGLFMEVHPVPDNALSDGPNMVKLYELKSILTRIMEIYEVVEKQKKRGSFNGIY